MCRLRALKNKKGFTLVEIIVVLVILAILAAFGIPSMIGFIEDARGKAYIAEARATYIAVQAIVTEDAALKDPKIGVTANPLADLEGDSVYLARITNMLAPDITYTKATTIQDLAAANGKVLGLLYKSASATDPYYVVMVPGSSAVSTKEEADALAAYAEAIEAAEEETDGGA